MPSNSLVNRKAAFQSMREFNTFSAAGVSTQVLINSNFGNPFSLSPFLIGVAPYPAGIHGPGLVGELSKNPNRAKPLCLQDTQTTSLKRAHNITNLNPRHKFQEVGTIQQESMRDGAFSGCSITLQWITPEPFPTETKSPTPWRPLQSLTAPRLLL